MDEQGFTILELLVGLVVVSILMVVAGYQFLGWQSRYEVETQVKDLYGDIMDMRMRAMQTNTMHFIRFDNMADTTYTVYRDDGDGVANPALDTPVNELSKTDLQYMLRWNGLPGPVNIQADSKGLMNLRRSVWVVDPRGLRYIPADNPELDSVDVIVDYDCIVIETTRINMGKLDNGGACVPK